MKQLDPGNSFFSRLLEHFLRGDVAAFAADLKEEGVECLVAVGPPFVAFVQGEREALARRFRWVGSLTGGGRGKTGD